MWSWEALPDFPPLAYPEPWDARCLHGFSVDSSFRSNRRPPSGLPGVALSQMLHDANVCCSGARAPQPSLRILVTSIVSKRCFPTFSGLGFLTCAL